MRLATLMLGLVLSITAAAKVSITDEEYARFKAATEAYEKLKANDEKTDAGRRKWHGAIVREEMREAELVKVMVYEDGFEWREPYKPKKNAMTAEERAAIKAAKLAEKAKRKPLKAAETEMKREEPREEIEVNEVIRPQGGAL